MSTFVHLFVLEGLGYWGLASPTNVRKTMVLCLGSMSWSQVGHGHQQRPSLHPGIRDSPMEEL